MQRRLKGDLAAGLALARAHSALADRVGAEGDRAEQRRHVDAALAIRRSAARLAPDDPAVQRAIVSSLWDLAQLDVDDGDLTAGLVAFQEVLEHYRVLAEAPTASDNDQYNLALAYKKVGAVRSALGEPEAALESLGRALAIDEQRLAADPGHPEVRLDVSFDHGDLGYALLQIGRAREAAAHYERAVALRRSVADADPQDVRAREVLRGGQLRLAAALAAMVVEGTAPCTELRPAGERALALWAEADAGGALDDEAGGRRLEVLTALARCPTTVKRN